MFNKIIFLLLVILIVSVTPAVAVQIEESNAGNSIHHIESYHMEPTITQNYNDIQKEVVPIITNDEQADFTPEDKSDKDTSSKYIKSIVTTVLVILLIAAVIATITYGVWSARCSSSITEVEQRISVPRAERDAILPEYGRVVEEVFARDEALFVLQREAIRGYEPYEWDVNPDYDYYNEERARYGGDIWRWNAIRLEGNSEAHNLGYLVQHPNPAYFEYIARHGGLRSYDQYDMRVLGLTMNNVGEVVSIAPRPTRLGAICEWYPPIYYELMNYDDTHNELHQQFSRMNPYYNNRHDIVNRGEMELARLRADLAFFKHELWIRGVMSAVIAAVIVLINFDSIGSTFNKWKSKYMKKWDVLGCDMFSH